MIWCDEVKRKQNEEAEGPLRTRKRARRSSPSPGSDLGGISEETPVVNADIIPERDTPLAPESRQPSPPASLSFSGRRRRVPRILKDFVPHSLVGLPVHLRPVPPRPSTPPAEPELLSPAPSPDPEPEPATDTGFTTEPNGFGLYRQYKRKPRSDPEDLLTLADMIDEDARPEQQQPEVTSIEAPCSNGLNFFHPFPNATVFRCINWFLEVSGTVSSAAFDRFIHEVALSDDFNRQDLVNFSTARELTRLDKYGATDLPFSADDGWKEGQVTLHLPKTKVKHASEDASPQVPISGIQYRPIVEVIKAACQNSQAKKYHWVPYKLVHQSQDEHVRAYTDIYNSDAMLEEDAEIRALARHHEDDPDTEVAILAMLLWSDSTHLAAFGTASLWPIYLYFGNLTKYARGRPNAHAAHHIAYIPSVSINPDFPVRDDLFDLSSPTLYRTVITRNMELQQRPKFTASSRSSSCRRSGS